MLDMRLGTVYNPSGLNYFQKELLATELALRRLKIAGTETGAGFTHIERDANFVFSQITKGAAGVQQVIKNTFGFSTSFLGFIVVNEALKTFSALTTGSVRSAAEFETGLTRVAKTTNLTASQLTQLGNNFRELARSTPITTQSLLSIAEIDGQLGIDGVNNIQKFSTVKIGRASCRERV